MDRLTPIQTHLLRQALPPTETTPSLPLLPEEVIRNIISKIDKADNETLAHMVQTSKDMARIVGADALVSFFYAARAAYDAGDSGKKAAVFCHLVGWIKDIADQLPTESLYQLFDHLSHMHMINSLDFKDWLSISTSIGELMGVISGIIKLQHEIAKSGGKIDYELLHGLQIKALLLRSNHQWYADKITTFLQEDSERRMNLSKI